MLRLWAGLAAVLVFLTLTVSSRAVDDALPDDEVAIQSCLEGVRDFNASSPDQPAGRDECIGTVAVPCLDEPRGQTTAGMVECYSRETAVWDGLLNGHYSALRESLEEGSFEVLRDTQRKWIAYRDAKCAWPSTFFEGGSIAGPIGTGCMNDATARRANELADYLDWMQN